MSRFSGRCDLYDHIMMQKMSPSADNPNILESDEYECFKIFKKLTDGVIYKSLAVKVTKENQNFVAMNCPYFSFEAIPTRGSLNFKYEYKLMGKPTSLKKINKDGGVYITIPIHFKTIFDLIPYYPYCLASMSHSDDFEHVVISADNPVDRQLESCINNGHLPYVDYKRILQEHYLEVFKSYYKEILEDN